MTLQDVANAISDAERLTNELPDTPERYAVVAQLQRAQTVLVGFSTDMLAEMAHLSAMLAEQRALIEAL